jgi:hypothetical protein
MDRSSRSSTASALSSTSSTPSTNAESTTPATATATTTTKPRRSSRTAADADADADYEKEKVKPKPGPAARSTRQKLPPEERINVREHLTHLISSHIPSHLISSHPNLHIRLISSIRTSPSISAIHRRQTISSSTHLPSSHLKSSTSALPPPALSRSNSHRRSSSFSFPN